MASISSRRLAKELKEIHTCGCPVGITLVKADDFSTWWFDIEVMGESLYKGEKHTLQFRFDGQYPISSPAVQFVVTDGRTAPVHPHIYSNGHICASILGTEWSPVLTVTAVCVTIQSMLASCKVMSSPEGNDKYVRFAPENPKKVRFGHDFCLVFLISYTR
ncbi:UBC-like protein [Fistulina hepatica ATCC 64428]|uniref:UBC-like protein n=1 Tax=Fistulina hepatica ATCC 64428 TaxID=1128425 RepID=A0A0D7A4G5_9AGAR|nr:UBC-like protein [Fistulina hepatica ATCC 64428]